MFRGGSFRLGHFQASEDWLSKSLKALKFNGFGLDTFSAVGVNGENRTGCGI